MQWLSQQISGRADGDWAQPVVLVLVLVLVGVIGVGVGSGIVLQLLVVGLETQPLHNKFPLPHKFIASLGIVQWVICSMCGTHKIIGKETPKLVIQVSQEQFPASVYKINKVWQISSHHSHISSQAILKGIKRQTLHKLIYRQ